MLTKGIELLVIYKNCKLQLLHLSIYYALRYMTAQCTTCTYIKMPSVYITRVQAYTYKNIFCNIQ